MDDEVLPRSKAAFAAARETVGISQAMLGTMLHVNSKTVKCWEAPAASATPSPQAWKLVTDLLKQVIKFTDIALTEAAEGPISLSIIRTTRKDMNAQIVNARVRAAMCAILSTGQTPTINYIPLPDDTTDLGTDMTGFITHT